MGLLDNDPIKRNSTLDHSDTETQLFDSQSSPPSVPDEDAFVTQLMNLDGETQVLDDSDGVANMGTQLLDECNNEAVDSDGGGTDRTEVLGDAEELSDDDSAKRVGSYPVDQENKCFTTMLKQDGRGYKAGLDGLINEEHSSGSIRSSFASVCGAALRTSGLAASNMAFKGTNSEPGFIKSDSQSSKQRTPEDNGITVVRDPSAFVEDIDQENLPEEYNEQMNGLRNEKKCSVGSSIVRRLFMDDAFGEIQRPNNYTNDADGGAGLPQLLAFGNEMAGLSYVDSQEPGEMSQVNALDAVDRFLKFNVMDFDQEVSVGRSTGGKTKPVSVVKGTQSLAKRTNLRSTAAERETFDWDDIREDEGGGEFFTRRKEAFFDNTEPQKLRHLDSKRSWAVDETRDKEEKLNIHQKVKGLVHFRSGLVYSKRNDKTTKTTKIKTKKNFTKELDEQLKISSLDGTKDTGIDKDMPEMLNVGFDTQMAAEAMGELCFGLDLVGHDNRDTNQGTKITYDGSSRGQKRNRARSKKDFLQRRSRSFSSGVSTSSKQKNSIGINVSKESSVLSLKQAKSVRKQCDTELVKAGPKKAKLNAEGYFSSNSVENIDKAPSEVVAQIKEKRSLKRNDNNKVDRCHTIASSRGCISVKKRRIQEQVGTFTPIACRTRQSRVTNQLSAGIASYDSREGINLIEASAHNDKREGDGKGGDALTMLNGKGEFSRLNSNQSGEPGFFKMNEQEKSLQKSTDTIVALRIGLSYNRGRRTHRKFSGQLNGSWKSVNQFVGQETNGQSLGESNRSKTNAVRPSMDLRMRRKTWSSACAAPVLPSSDRQSEGGLFHQIAVKGGSGGADRHSVDDNVVLKDLVGALSSKCSDRQNDADAKLADEGAGGNARLEVSPGDRCTRSRSTAATPANFTSPVSSASPICRDNEYLKQSRRKNLPSSFLVKEINSLFSNGPEPSSIINVSRRRRDMANVRVLFSKHLDEDIIKQQKKILARLGASVASSISEATHFVTDNFVRTRNMLEAIALGKPVVTQLWLESCGQASCFIDERNYILRDTKKEKELGFSLPVSLARACKYPLLQGHKVFITPNTKPGNEILASLVKAVHGLVVERIGRSAFQDDNIPDDLLVLSCEEDYAVCVPFLEKGAAVYSSELLLNGIIAQKLRYERHRLFVDHMKRTRSTIQLKQNNNQYFPVTKCK